MDRRPDCLDCRHMDEYHLACKAFPNGIPEDILRGEPHIKPVPGQANNIVFEPLQLKKNTKNLMRYCQNCINYWGDTRCRAFPGGIPKNIINGNDDHNKPFPGQGNDIIFEPMKG